MICGKYMCVLYFFHHSHESLFWVTNLKIRLGFMVKLMGKEKLSVTMWKRSNIICFIYGTIWNHRCRRFSVWFSYNNKHMTSNSNDTCDINYITFVGNFCHFSFFWYKGPRQLTVTLHKKQSHITCYSNCITFVGYFMLHSF